MNSKNQNRALVKVNLVRPLAAYSSYLMLDNAFVLMGMAPSLLEEVAEGEDDDT